MAVIPRGADLQAAAGALALRRWALRLLAGGRGRHGRALQTGSLSSPQAGGNRAPRSPNTTREAWELFLTSEVCALPLSRWLDADPLALSAESSGTEDQTAGRDPVVRAAAREMQFALGARAELFRLEELACARGWKVVLLKGGVAACGAAPVYLSDLDVLVHPTQAEALGRALADAGYARGTGAESLQHLPARHRPRGLAVEIHHSLRGLEGPEALIERAVPLTSRREGLCRLAPTDHLRHLLVHAGRHHPERRGMLRDLMLTRAAVEDCDPSELKDVTDWLERQPDSEVLAAQLTMARALAAGRPSEDPFRRIARRRYLTVRVWGGAGEAALTGFARRRALTFLCGDRPWREELRAELAKPPTDSALPVIRSIGRKAPALAAGARRVLRVGRFATAAAMGAAVLWGERRLEARYGSGLSDSSAPNGKNGSRAASEPPSDVSAETSDSPEVAVSPAPADSSRASGSP